MVCLIGGSGRAYLYATLQILLGACSLFQTIHKSCLPTPRGRVCLILGSSHMEHIFTQIRQGKGTPAWKGILEPDCGKDLTNIFITRHLGRFLATYGY